MKSDNRLKTGIFYFIGFVVMCIIFIVLPEKDKSILNFISLLGSYTSVFGLIVAYLQISSVKETAEATKIEVDLANKRVFQILSVSDLSKSIKLVHEIQNYLISDKLEPAMIRLKDLKAILINLKFNSDLKPFTESDDYTKYLTNVGMNMTSLTNQITGAKSNLNISKVLSDLETIESALGEFENRLKFGQHDK